MKILVLSDSHRRYLDDIKFNEFDYIFHCGDYGPSKPVLENNNNIYYIMVGSEGGM